MKRNLGIILFLASISFMLTGCSANDFFDVHSAMSPPVVSVEQAEIESLVGDYLQKDFKLSYLMIDNKYSSSLKCSVGGEEYVVVFCETEDDFVKSHCMFFEKKSGEWALKDDVVEGNFKFQSACVRDVNGDGLDEIVIDGMNVNNSSVKTHIYQIQKNGIIPVQ